jgi:hypothetical protein
VSVHGNLLFMSVEQTRGRLDCGADGVTETGERRALPRRPHLRHHRPAQPEAGGGVQTCRGSHTHTLVTDPKDRPTSTSTDRAPGASAVGRRARGAASAGPQGSQHGALQHRRHQGAARQPERPPSSTGRASSRMRRPARSAACGRAATTGPARSRRADQPVPRHHGVSGDRAGRRRLLGQRHPARHLGPGQSEAARRGRRQELRLLALGDVQQRRHQGRLHRRVGRRHASALPRRRICRPGAPTRSSTSWTASSCSGATTSCRRRRPTGELRAHNGSLIPVPGRDIMVQGWYQGGVSVFDFTDSANPVEIAYFDRGPSTPRS